MSRETPEHRKVLIQAFDPEPDTRNQRTYLAACACAWRGTMTPDHQVALSEARAHRDEHEPASDADAA